MLIGIAISVQWAIQKLTGGTPPVTGLKIHGVSCTIHGANITIHGA